MDLNGVEGPQSQLPITDASQKHINSLTQESTYQFGNSSATVGPSTLDLNGAQGPEFQLPITDASQRHIDSLTQQIHSHNGGPSTNHYNAGPSNLDLNGAQGPQSQLRIRDASERHIDSLTKQIQITNQGVGIFNEPYNTGPSTLDLNGLPGPAFNRGKNSTLKQDLLSEIYQSSVNPLASYGAGQPGGDWPSVKPSPLGANFADLDGSTPRGYVNPATGVSY